MSESSFTIRGTVRQFYPGGVTGRCNRNPKQGEKLGVAIVGARGPGSAMDSWGWAIVLAAVAAVTAMLLMALYDEISRRRWIAKNGAERRSTSHSLREAEACRGSSAAPAAPAAPVSPVRTDPPPVTRPPPKGVGAVGEFAGDVAVRARAREAIRPSTLEVPDDTQVSPASAAVLVGGARHRDGDGGGDEDRPRQKPKQKPRRTGGSPEQRPDGSLVGVRQPLGDGGVSGGGAGAAVCACAAVPAARERLPQVHPPAPPLPRLRSRSGHPLARSTSPSTAPRDVPPHTTPAPHHTTPNQPS